jgi:hypothetical protein
MVRSRRIGWGSCYEEYDRAPSAGPQYINAAAWRDAQDARRFLLDDEKSFQNVCICADIEPGYLRRRARRVIDEVDVMVKATPPTVITQPYRSQRMSA